VAALTRSFVYDQGVPANQRSESEPTWGRVGVGSAANVGNGALRSVLSWPGGLRIFARRLLLKGFPS
jgi:hypothetical protein